MAVSTASTWQKNGRMPELMMPPVLEEPRRLRGDLPVIRVRQAPPLIDLVAQVVDDGDRLVSLLCCGNAGGILELQVFLREGLFALPGFGMGVMN